MKHLWNKRRLAALGTVAAVVGVTLWVVLPALGASSNSYYGHMSTGQSVKPTYLATGGQKNDCELFTLQGATVGTDQYLVSNPKSINTRPQTVTATNGMTVTFTVNVDKSFTYLDFSVTGAIVTDVGIKGGDGTDWYSYEDTARFPGGGVTHDEGLTAPAQSVAGEPPYYGLSQTVFCYTPKITCQAGVAFGDPSVPGYTIELPSCDGKDGVFYDFATGTTTGGQTFFSLHTDGASTSTQTPMIENITGTLGSSSQATLKYNDDPSADPSDPSLVLYDMRFCQVDPSVGPSDPMALATAYQDASSKDSVLQPPSVDDPSTSCLISWHTWVDLAGAYHYQAYVYSLVDGLRTIG